MKNPCPACCAQRGDMDDQQYDRHAEGCPWLRAFTREYPGSPMLRDCWEIADKRWQSYWRVHPGDWVRNLESGALYRVSDVSGDQISGPSFAFPKTSLRPATVAEIVAVTTKMPVCPGCGIRRPARGVSHFSGCPWNAARNAALKTALVGSNYPDCETHADESWPQYRFAIGKSYRTRDGSKATIVSCGGEPRFVWICHFCDKMAQGFGVDVDGKCYHACGAKSPKGTGDGSTGPQCEFDLVEPWPDNPEGYEIIDWRNPKHGEHIYESAVPGSVAIAGMNLSLKHYILKPKASMVEPSAAEMGLAYESSMREMHASTAQQNSLLKAAAGPQEAAKRPVLVPETAQPSFPCQFCGRLEGERHRSGCIHYRAEEFYGPDLAHRDFGCCPHCKTSPGQMHSHSCPDHSYRRPFGWKPPEPELCPCCRIKITFVTGVVGLDHTTISGPNPMCPECHGTGEQERCE